MWYAAAACTLALALALVGETGASAHGALADAVSCGWGCGGGRGVNCYALALQGGNINSVCARPATASCAACAGVVDERDATAIGEKGLCWAENGEIFNTFEGELNRWTGAD